MSLVEKARSLFAVGECATPPDRALVTEQFRILVNQVPILYAVLVLDSISVGFVLAFRQRVVEICPAGSALDRQPRTHDPMDQDARNRVHAGTVL